MEDELNKITELFIKEDYIKDLLFCCETEKQEDTAREFLNRITEELKKLYIPTAIENV